MVSIPRRGESFDLETGAKVTSVEVHDSTPGVLDDALQTLLTRSDNVESQQVARGGLDELRKNNPDVDAALKQIRQDALDGGIHR